MDGQKKVFVRRDAPMTVGARESEENLIKQRKAWANPTVKQLLFNLPFSLRTPEGFRLNNKETIDASRFPLRLNPHPNTVFEVKIGTDNYGRKCKGEFIAIQLRFCYQSTVPKTSPIQFGGTVSFGGDRLGKFSHTKVLANIPLESINDDFKWDNGLYCDLVVDAVNLFVEHYAVVTRIPGFDRFHYQRLTSYMIMAFTVLTDFDDFAYDVEEYFDLNGQIIGELPEADAVTLKELIASGEPPALLDALHSQIRNSLDLKDWRSAAIDSAILLETWLTPKLKAAYTAKGLKNREIKERFKTGELHLPISLGDILVTLIPDALGFNFDGSDEYEALKTKTITLRNHIVHGRKHFVTKAEAELSYASVNKAIEFIEKATAN